MPNPTEKEIMEALNTLIRAEIYPLTSENILLLKDNYLLLGNEIMGGAEIGTLATECKLIQETRIWKIMQENIRFEAFKFMSEANNTEGMMPGKWMLHNLNAQKGVMDTILEAGTKIAPPKNVSKK
jgi:hypothetical protein